MWPSSSDIPFIFSTSHLFKLLCACLGDREVRVHLEEMERQAPERVGR